MNKQTTETQTQIEIETESETITESLQEHHLAEPKSEFTPFETFLHRIFGPVSPGSPAAAALVEQLAQGWNACLEHLIQSAPPELRGHYETWRAPAPENFELPSMPSNLATRVEHLVQRCHLAALDLRYVRGHWYVRVPHNERIRTVPGIEADAPEPAVADLTRRVIEKGIYSVEELFPPVEPPAA